MDRQNPDVPFGTLLRTHRVAASLTQQELASRARMSVASIRDFEQGRRRSPRPQTLDRLIAVLAARVPQAEELRSARDGTHGCERDGHDLAGGHVVPRQLPPDAYYFCGRAEELLALTATLTNGRAPKTGAVRVINGMPGVGKTTLAVHWAHQVAGEFPDGQLYIDLHGFDGSGQPVEPGEALRLIFDSFSVAPELVPGNLESRVSLYRSLMAGKRLLLVLDNAYDLHQVRPLLPGAEGCAVTITSRAELTGLAAVSGASLVKLDVLTEADAQTMLANRLGRSRVAGEPCAARQLAELCAGLPLALSLVAARAVSRPDFPLTALVSDVAEAGRRLDAIDAPHTGGGVREAFSWSYQNLGPQAARVFRMLGVLGAHQGRDVTDRDMAVADEIPVNQASAALRELSYLSLATERSPGRFCLHELLACYAAELSGIASTQS
jgi:transcriptional regulator with XRE-family HTH domain